MLSRTVTRTGNQDHLVFIKGLGTQPRGQEGTLGFSLIPRLCWPPCICTLLSIPEGPLFFFPPADFLLKLTGTNSERPQMEFSDPSIKRLQPLSCDGPACPPVSPFGWKRPQSRSGPCDPRPSTGPGREQVYTAAENVSERAGSGSGSTLQ